MKITKLTLTGEEKSVEEISPSAGTLKLKKTYDIQASVRDDSKKHAVVLDKDDVVELKFNDDTKWISSPYNLHEVFPEIEKKNRDGEFELPTSLTTSTDRGIFKIVLDLFTVYTKQEEGVKKLAWEYEGKKLETDTGLFKVGKEFPGKEFKFPENETFNKPHLLFIHGTFSSTETSFGKLKGSDTWNYILRTYGENILGYQHRTLTESPLQNVLDLINALPSEITLDLITHSRGGLVGDILVRFSSSSSAKDGFTQEELKILDKEKRGNDIKLINKIRDAVRSKKINIRKYIRVACPAMGTILASNRLDTLLNVLSNFTPGFPKDLIAAAINSKNDVETLPGIEAMDPESPLIKALNSGTNLKELSANDDSMIVISGDSNINFSLHGLVTILTNIYYREDNDFVVNSRSMYRGTRRHKLVQYFLDEGSDVDHFKYFSNPDTQEKIHAALEKDIDKPIDGFFTWSIDKKIISSRGPLNDGLLSAGKECVPLEEVSKNKPILILIPDIMGSTIYNGNDKVWIDIEEFEKGNLSKIENIHDKKVHAKALIASSYKKIIDQFSGEYDVLAFPYEWRKSVTSQAKILKDKISGLLKHNLPLKIIAHSAGGLLVREFIINHPAEWSQLNNSKGFKMIFLGTPLGGSFRIPSLLCGRESAIKKLALVDIQHNKYELMKIFSGYPGVLDLLPLAKGKHDFSKAGEWKDIFEAAGYDRECLISDKHLSEFKQFKDKTLNKTDSIDYTNIIYIAGQSDETLCDFEIENNNGKKEIIFYSTANGDGCSDWESGIPKKMRENDSVYYIPVVNGELANTEDKFTGFAEILSSGQTVRFSKNRHNDISGRERFRSPEKADFDTSQEGFEKSILGLNPDFKPKSYEENTPITVCVTNGDLKYSSFPVLAGHFKNDGILYAEKVINGYLDNFLDYKHRLGIYPGDVGTSQICRNRADSVNSNFKGAVIIGVGEPGKLTASRLQNAVELGVTNYLLEDYWCNKQKVNPDREPNGLTSLLICCGFGGLDIEGSVYAILQGITKANSNLKKIFPVEAAQIDFIEFIEQYEDKAYNAFNALDRFKKDNSHIIIEGNEIVRKPGSLERPPLDSTQGWWTRVSVQMKEEDDPCAENKNNEIEFRVFTGGAREEKSTLKINKKILGDFNKRVSEKSDRDPEVTKTIFELMIPNDFKDFLRRQNNISWILDKYTASYPWEMLHDPEPGTKPNSITSGMIRQLSTSEYKSNVKEIINSKALIIADPNLEDDRMQLPGAAEEGEIVKNILEGKKFDTTSLIKKQPDEIIKKLFSQEYKIIHLAGHGNFDPADDNNTGMLIGKDVILTTNLINQMSSAPELVFINCCHLGKTEGGAETRMREVNKLAANIGTQLIENGVKAVIAAGWAVNDSAAFAFAKSFYDLMFEGYNFGDAVRKSRERIYKKFGHTNTWGAYQCYGDQFYKFRETENVGKDSKKNYFFGKQALIDLNNLENKLDVGHINTEGIKKELEAISKAMEKNSVEDDDPGIIEKQGLIYYKICEYEKAIEKFQTLLRHKKNSYSFNALEIYCQLSLRKHFSDYRNDKTKRNELKEKINEIKEHVDYLLKLGKTSSRYRILGSINKRISVMETEPEKKIEQLIDGAYNFYSAHGVKSQYDEMDQDTYLNWINLEFILMTCCKKEWGKTNEVKYKLSEYDKVVSELKRMKEDLNKFNIKQNKYWDYVRIANINLTLFIFEYGRQKTKGGKKSKTTGTKSENYIAVLESYKKAWAIASTELYKQIEIENIWFLIDSLSFNGNGNSELIKELTKLKDELENIVKKK